MLPLLVGGLLLSPGGDVQGQQGLPSRSTASPPGWIGIVHEGDGQGAPAFRDFPGGYTGLVVKDVVAGSPALAAGLRPGDVLVALDGRPLAAESPGMLQVRDGQAVRLRLLREGRVVETRLVAARRPSDRELAALSERSARVDSLRVRIIQEMDSLLERDQRLGRSHSIISIFRVDEERDPVVVAGERGAWEEQRPGIWGWVPGSVGQDSAGVPFGAFVLSRDRVDGLVAELREVQGSLEALEAEEMARLLERTAGEANRVNVVRLEADLQRVREAQRRLHGEARRLEEEMRLEGQRSVRRAPAPPPAWTPAAAPPGPGRPLSPYLLGQRMVAGAEVTALNPELAEYFGGEEGLLVLQVISGSPAAEAGMQAGDVITRMGDRRVRTLDQARTALDSSGQGPIPVTLVRRGRTVLATLPR